MKNSKWAIFLLLVLAFCVSGCGVVRTVRGSGRADEEVREVSDFSGVELATIGNLYVELGDTDELRIEADDNLLRYFETEVDDGVLQIGSRRGISMLPREPIAFYVTTRRLDTAILAGLGTIEFPEDLVVEGLTVKITGSGHVEIDDLEADRFEVVISGLGDLYIEDGEVREQTVTITGGGNYRGKGLVSETATVRVTGLGSATVWASEHLDVEISGGGSVRYAGNPEVEQDVSGLGRVEHLGD